MIYNPIKIEEKWQDKWNKECSHKTDFSDVDNKFYCLTMFSYPSGDKLHVGHWYNYGPVDTFARFMKMNGKNVFQPQGFDAFGLPAENYAIKHGVPPKDSTYKNIEKMRKQLKRIGAIFNWENEVITCAPDYYKWNQWLFLKLYEMNLAYQKEAMVNWDPIDQTVLANEQVLSDGTSERSGGIVEQKALKQWFLKITSYSDRLLDFSKLDWPKKTILMQKNWIGRSEGANIKFKIKDLKDDLNVFTTRPDTLFGCTYMVIAPEHPLLNSLDMDNKINDYLINSRKKSELQRLDLDKEKTGVFSGLYATNPANDKEVPIWIADYVLMNYGSGAIMAVPGHDQRDFEFAKKYNLPIVKVVDDKNVSIDEKAFTESGVATNSQFLDGLTTDKAIDKMLSWIQKEDIGEKSKNYRLKDWLISRQRYWGTPIPIVYDPKGKAHAIPEEHLPWLLPTDVNYKPKGTSPLGSSRELIERTENIFGKGWRPEIDTMDTFMCSSWYFLRYLNAHLNDKPFDKSRLDWLPVDLYVGGAEHATMHLLYSRFVIKALKDAGCIDFDEPFNKLVHQGTITKDGTKMSKSKGNTVSPDVFIDQYGSDTFRAYLMFMGPYEDGGDWNDKGITGIYRFIKKIWNVVVSKDDNKVNINNDTNTFLHKTIKVVTNDLKSMKFNTAISRLMEFTNHLNTLEFIPLNIKEKLVQLIAPITPHLSEELWEYLGHSDSIFEESWPKYNEKMIVDDNMNIVVQVNGKVRANKNFLKNSSKTHILDTCRKIDNVEKYIHSGTVIKEIYVSEKLVNFVVKIN